MNGPQQLDLDEYVSHFRTICPSADNVIYATMTAIDSLNSGELKGCALMLGEGYEELFAYLLRTFEEAISNPVEKASFREARGYLISMSYPALNSKLDLLVAAGRIPKGLIDVVSVILPAMEETIERLRATSAHADAEIGRDSLISDLMALPECTQRVYGLIEYLKTNPAD